MNRSKKARAVADECCEMNTLEDEKEAECEHDL